MPCRMAMAANWCCGRTRLCAPMASSVPRAAPSAAMAAMPRFQEWRLLALTRWPICLRPTVNPGLCCWTRTILRSPRVRGAGPAWVAQTTRKFWTQRPAQGRGLVAHRILFCPAATSSLLRHWTARLQATAVRSTCSVQPEPCYRPWRVQVLTTTSAATGMGMGMVHREP